MKKIKKICISPTLTCAHHNTVKKLQELFDKSNSNINKKGKKNICGDRDDSHFGVFIDVSWGDDKRFKSFDI